MSTTERRTLPIAIAMAAAVTLAMAACSGEPEGEASSGAQGGTGASSGGTGASSGGTLALADLCETFVDDLCTVLMQCAGWDYCDLDHCRADQECLGMASLEAEIASGWVEYDPAAAGACHDKLRADPCNFGSFLFVPTVPEVLFRCPGVLTPQQGAGESCASPVDCTPDTHCIATTACPGTCTPWLTEGQPCQIGAGPRCDPRIDLECRDGTCRPPWALGDPCTIAADCYPSLWCDMTAGTCQPTAKAGEPCDNGGQMAPHCDQDLDLWCDSLFDVGTCQPISPSGGPCLNDGDCQEPLTCLPDMGFPNPGICGDRVPVGGACDSFNDCIDNLCGSSMCIPRAGEGEACSTSLPCQDGLSCEQSVCRAPTCPGAHCDVALDTCSLSLCINQVCTPRAALGQPCAVDDDCASGSCNAGTCVDPEGCVP